MKKPGKTKVKAKTKNTESSMEQDQTIDLGDNTFSSGTDICQQLMDRYAKSAAPQHRHLLATAAAMRSNLAAESLPLTPPSYFAAAITAVDDLCSSESSLDPDAVTALLSFLAIALPLVPRRGISAQNATEAMAVLVGLVEREGEKLAASTVRAVVKCLAVLVIGFCDLEDWGSVRLGFEALLKLSIDKRPKVRRCAQDCLEKSFKSFQCSTIIIEASNLVLLLLRSYLPLAVKLSASLTDDEEAKDETLSKPEHLDVLHMLNVLKLIVPFLHTKVKSEVLSELHKKLTPKFSPLTSHILKLIEVFFETSRVDIMPQVESIIITLTSYVSLREKNPVDTIISAANLLKNALLHAGESSSGIMKLPTVCESVAGLLSSESSIASQASSILKELLDHHVDKETLCADEEQPSEVKSKASIKRSVIKSTCSIFENFLNASDEIPNEHLLAVISTLFIKLGDTSPNYMKDILLRLAVLMTSGGGDMSKTEHLQNCIGSAVTAMGPEKILTLVPITLRTDDLTCSNIWLVPILKNYVVGTSLRCYIEHIDPLANSFLRASHKVKKSAIGKDLQAHAHGLWGLLPAFCHYPTDTYKQFGLLAELLVTYLRKHTFMHENVAVALQILVNQNKSVLSAKEDDGEGKTYKEKGSIVEHRTSYSKKIATKNIRALSSHAAELLQALINLFMDSISVKRSHLKDAIGGLASVSDSSVTKKIFMALLGRYQLLNEKGEPEELENKTDESIAKEQGDSSTSEKEIKRSAMIELASALVEGAKEDLVDLIFNFLKETLKASNEIGQREAYRSLSRILEEHTWFCSSRFDELVDLLLGLKSPVDMTSLKSRFACFHILIVHALKISSEDEENTKGFLILNEIILILKDGDEEARKVAYDRLLVIGSSLKNSSSAGDNEPYHKLIVMIMGYLSGASPHIKSGAVSALSVLVHNDPGICVSMPELVPSIVSLLQGKAIEVVKAALGFLKVLALCLPPKDLQNFLPEIVKQILPWSAVSRNHFRLKVTTILEIVLRKCGTPAVKLVTPERYNNYIKTVLENRQNKGSKESETADMETTAADSSTRRSQERTQNENGSKESWKRKRDWGATNESDSNEKLKRGKVNENDRGNWKRRDSQQNTNTKFGKRPRDFDNDRSMKGRSEGDGEQNKRTFNRGPKGDGKPNMGRKGSARGGKPQKQMKKFGGKQRK